MTTIGPDVGTCLVCGVRAPIVNLRRQRTASGQVLVLGYLGRHHRPRTRQGTQCRGSFGSWREQRAAS